MSIAIIVCYIGKLPWYFDCFVHSCKYNSTISFFVLTDDQSYSRNIPSNLKIQNWSLEDLNSHATSKLGFQTNIKDGYKLCDFKPTYGLLFGDLIKGYDYWGHADIDVIFGDIRAFISRTLLANFEMISVRHDFLTGQFLLFKNNVKMNSLFTLSKDYKVILSDEKHFCFDETNFQWDAFTDGRKYYEIPSEIESMTHLVMRLREENYLKVHFDFLIIEGLPGKLKWENGRLLYKGKFEVLLYHLILFKKVCKQGIRKDWLGDSFSISTTRIYHTSKKRTLAE